MFWYNVRFSPTRANRYFLDAKEKKNRKDKGKKTAIKEKRKKKYKDFKIGYDSMLYLYKRAEMGNDRSF